MSNSEKSAEWAAAIPPEALSVSGQILQCFVDALSKKSGSEELAARLRTAIIEKRETSEAALRRALFGEDDQ